jgi:hypothetical protein
LNQSKNKIEIYVMQRIIKNIFVFHVFFQEGFEKPRSLFKVMVTIKIINKIFFVYNKICFKNIQLILDFFITDENVWEIDGEDWSMFVYNGMGIFVV